jgi:hypothetical protein
MSPTGAEPGTKVHRESRAGKHLSRYKTPSPSEIPANAKVRVIKQGDTLWDLAKEELGDPLFWPQIWEVNRYITNPHWIFPGDSLVIPRTMVVTRIQEEKPKVVEQEFVPKPAPQPIATLSDIYCSPYIEEPKPPEPKVKKEVAKKSEKEEECELNAMEQKKKKKKFKVPGEEDALAIEDAYDTSKIDFSPGDYVYLNKGSNAGLKMEDEFFILDRGEPLYHPVKGNFIGNVIGMTGRLKIVELHDEAALGEIEETCSAVTVGMFLKPFEPIPIPLSTGFTPMPRVNSEPSGKISGYIVYVKEGLDTAGEGHLVNIDLGSEDQIYPGDFFTIFRDVVLESHLARKVLGELVVLRVEKHSAAAKIISSYKEINPGDRIELK